MPRTPHSSPDQFSKKIPPGCERLPDDKRLFLSNLATDVGEKGNLAAAHPEVVRRLLKLRQQWASQQNEPLDAAPYQDRSGNEK